MGTRSRVRARVLRALALAATLSTAAHAGAPLSAELVEGELARAAQADDAGGLAALVAILPHLDALTPEAARAGLAALSEGPSLRAVRARLELAAREGKPAGDGFFVRALAVAVLAPDTPLVGLHRELANAGLARAGDAFRRDDPDRRWEIVDSGPPGAIALDRLVPATDGVTLHVVIPLAADAPMDGVLRLGATGDLVVSVADAAGGRTLGQAIGLAHGVADQIELPLRLGRGASALLISLHPNPSEPALLRVRFEARGAASGAPSGAAGESARWPPFEASAVPANAAWNEAVQRLLATRPIPGLVLARMLGLPDVARRGSALLEERLASAALGTRELLLTLEALRRPEDQASRLLERLESRASRDPELLLALAEHMAGRGQLVQAGALVAEAGRSGETPSVLYMRARLARLAHAPEEALIAYGVATPGLAPADALARLRAASERERVEVAQAALDLGRADLGLAIVTSLAEAAPGRLDLGQARIRAALAAGEGALAASLALGLARLRPDRPALALDAADKLIARDDGADLASARALVDGILPLLRWKPDALVDAGRLLEALADRPAATAAYARALEVSPAHEGARRSLERLQGAEPVPLSLTLDEVVGSPVTDPEASFEVLGEERFVKVRADGSATHWVRRIMRAQAVPEAREGRTLELTFDPSQESLRVLEANVRRATEGPISSKTLAEPVPERLLHSVSEDWYGLYYDLRRLSIPFDDLHTGDVITVTWRIDPVGQLFPGVFDLFEVLLDRVPKHLHRIVVETPPGLALTTRLGVPDGAHVNARERKDALPDGGTRHFVEVTDLPGLPRETLAPGTAEVSPVWQATTFASWRDVATWYRRLVEPQKVLTPAMKAFVAEARQKSATPGELLLRLSGYVTREIRYVGLEFGIHGSKPYRTDEVWTRRFGDCKDKATLLSALLAEAGVEGDVTLLRTRRQGRLQGALPSLSLFDHAVLYLPSRDELVDPTATHYGLGELPKEDQGAQILVLAAPDHPLDLALSRVDPPTRNGVTGTYSVTLTARGQAGIQGTVAFLGTQAPPYRALLLDPASQKTRLAELMNRRFPGLTLRDFRLSDPADRTRPMELVFHAEVPRFGQIQGAGAEEALLVTRPTGIDGHGERFASEEERRLPLVLGPPMTWDVTYRYILPEGHRVKDVPRGGEGEGPFGRYRVTWLDEGQVVTVRAELTYLVDQVAPADYPGLRDFVRAFDAVVSPPLVLARAAGTPARTGGTAP